METLVDIISYIVARTVELKKKYVSEPHIGIDFICIFCQSDEEYLKLDRLAREIGHQVQDTPTGFTYAFYTPFASTQGPIKLLKIRKPFATHPERGDADININYAVIKEKYLKDPHFKCINRSEGEMIELMDPDFDVRVYFEKSVLSKELGV